MNGEHQPPSATLATLGWNEYYAWYDFSQQAANAQVPDILLTKHLSGVVPEECKVWLVESHDAKPYEEEDLDLKCFSGSACAIRLLGPNEVEGIRAQEFDAPSPDGSVNDDPTSANDDPINPSYYKLGKLEVIDVIEEVDANYCLGNAIKYIARAGLKDPSKESEDLQKACWYLNREEDTSVVYPMVWEDAAKIADDWKLPFHRASALVYLLTGKTEEALRIIQQMICLSAQVQQLIDAYQRPQEMGADDDE